MKSTLLVFMFMIITLLCGCSGTDRPEPVYRSTAPKIMFDKIISAMDDRDSEKLKSLFSQNALEGTPNIDKQIEELMGMYKGKFVSNSHFNSGAGPGTSRNGVWVYLSINPIVDELVTDEAVYYLRFFSVAANEDNPNDVGLWGIWLKLKVEGQVIDECEVDGGCQNRPSR